MTVGKAVTGTAVLAALLGALWFLNPLEAPTETVVPPAAEASAATETELEIAEVPESPESSTTEATTVAMVEEFEAQIAVRAGRIHDRRTVAAGDARCRTRWPDR